MFYVKQIELLIMKSNLKNGVLVVFGFDGHSGRTDYMSIAAMKMTGRSVNIAFMLKAVLTLRLYFLQVNPMPDLPSLQAFWVLFQWRYRLI